MAKKEKTRSSMQEHRILEILRQNGGSCRTAELAARLDVSEETVRRNVKRLVHDGIAVRVHGGVFLANVTLEPAFGARLKENRTAKTRMAQSAAKLIGDGASVFLDNSTTTTFVAEALRTRRNLFVVTNSVSAAARLATHNGNRIFFAGGELRAGDGGAYGAEAMDFLRGFQPDFAILAASAVNAETGFMLSDYAEAAVARLFVANARNSIFVADASKMGLSGPIKVTEPENIACLVSDAAPPQDLSAALDRWGVRLVLAEGDEFLTKDKANGR